MNDQFMPRFATGLMVFLGAFLAFSLEPIVGRLVTPFFGGAVHVWTVSLMIFQALLLSGYLYAHLVAPRIGRWHLLLLLLPLVQWPLGFSSEFSPKAPIASLAGALLTHISLLFAALSTTAVVAQSWWYGSEATGPHRASPYFLYGISNLGAMIALFTYPFLIEPLFGVTFQRLVWSIGYLGYVGATLWVWLLLRPGHKVRAPDDTAVASPSKLIMLRWLVLSAAPSALLLAVTNLIAMEVGSFPMIWVFPLALYLASFIVTFREPRGKTFHRFDFWLIEIALLALLAGSFISIKSWMVPLGLIPFYALCVIANGQLYRLRPSPQQLTHFYLIIAVGGLIGGLLVSLAAPMVFTGLAEYPLAILAIIIASWGNRPLSWWKDPTQHKSFGWIRISLVMSGCLVVGLSLWKTAQGYSMRNFYGISRIIDVAEDNGVPSYRKLIHGVTVHGLQYLNPSHRNTPLAYYYAGGGLEEAVSLRARPATVAMVGLGSGSALSWFGAGESVTVFEIDPDMEKLARGWFWYLKDTAAQVKIRVGDARLNLLDETLGGTPPYDVIFIDAFSGDGIPTHLLTLEALDIYLSRLKEDGSLVFHISNRFYDLRPVLKAAAHARKLTAVTSLQPRNNPEALNYGASVVVMARHPTRLSSLLAEGRWAVMGDGDGHSDLRVWSDDYVNILAPLLAKWSQ